MKDYESIVEQIKKVKILAENGISGEKENAKNLLEKLLKKYKISLEELITDETKEYKFKFTTEYERKILNQCVAKFAPTIKQYIRYKTSKGVFKKNIIGIELTKMQFLDIKTSAKFYTALFAKELDLFFIAFISKHDIFRETTSNDEASESTLTPEEAEAIRNMMSGLSDTSYIPTRKQIE